MQLQDKTQTLRKSYAFLSKACTHREHININDYNKNNKKYIKKWKKRKKTVNILGCW